MHHILLFYFKVILDSWLSFFVSVKFLILSSLSVLMKVTVVCSVSISMKDLIVDSLLKDGDFTPKGYTRFGVCFFSV